jgi:hypothetical protein
MYMTLQLNSFKADGSSKQQYSNIHSCFLSTKYLINIVQNFKQPSYKVLVFFSCGHFTLNVQMLKKKLGKRHDLCKKS